MGKTNEAPVKTQWSKIITLTVILLGFGIAQECMVLMALCILRGYASAAAWLTAAVGLAEAVMGAGLTGYLSLARSDHREGGVTFEAAKAKGFNESSRNSPPI